LRARALGVLFVVFATHAGAADMVVFSGPPEAGVEAAAARDAIARTAAVAGAAFVDLSPAPPPAPAAASLLARGVEHFEALRLDEAEAALDEALADARRTGAAGLSTTQLSDLFLHRALVHTQRGGTPRAWDELLRAASVDPARHLDPARFPPKVIAAFQRAAAAVAGGGFGKLIVSAPPGCRVLIDGRAGDAPPQLPHGEHFVRRECPGERAAGAVVLLAQPSQTLELPRAAAEAPGDAALLALARERGASRLLYATVRASSLAPPTVRLRLVDGRNGKTLSEATAAAGDPQSVRSATERLLVPSGVVVTPAPPPRERWYEKPWLWAVAGAALTAAVLLPLVVDDQRPGGFSVRPEGVP
jgi:hypothetical protein